MAPLLYAASARIVIDRCSLPLHILLRPDNPLLLGAMLSQRSAAIMSLQRKRFIACERLRLLRCSGALSALLIRFAVIIDCRGLAVAQKKIIDRIMRRFFSGAAHMQCFKNK